MGGGVSKKRRTEEEAAKPERLRDDAARREAVEAQFRAYQESLRREKAALEREKEGKFGNTSSSRATDEDGDGNQRSSAHSAREANERSAATLPAPEDDEPPPRVQIPNQHVFETFSDEFKARFVEENPLGQHLPRGRGSRFKKVDKVVVRHSRSEGSQQFKFDVSSVPWLHELNASFDDPCEGSGGARILNDDNSNSNGNSNSNSIPGNSGDRAHLVDAKNRSIASLSEINTAHLDASCLALDLSCNRLNETRFGHALRHLLYLNVSGNFLVSLWGINCCENLIGLNASSNLITTLLPLRDLLSLESLVVSSNKLCCLLDEDAFPLLGESGDPQIMNRSNGAMTAQQQSLRVLPPKLQRLDVSHNADLTSLRGVGHMPQLQWLRCTSCGLTRLDEGLGQLQHLTTLNMRRNKIASLADVTSTLPALTSLTSLDLSENEFVAADEKEGKGMYYMAMLELSQGRLRVQDSMKILDKDYKRYAGLKSEIQCEKLVADLNSECDDNTLRMNSILDNLSSRHRLEEAVLREAVRTASATERTKFAAYTSFVNEKLRELKVAEKMSPESAGDIQNDVERMKRGTLTLQPPDD